MSWKYVIEIEEAPYKNNQSDSEKLYKAACFNSLVFDQNGIDKLTPYDADSAYAEGYTAAESKYRGIQDDGYQRGLNDAWDAVKKIAVSEADGGYSYDELDECFGEMQGSIIDMFVDYTAAEAIEKIREYEQRKAREDAEIKVGDEVKNEDNVVGVAFRVNDNDVSLICNSECGYVLRLCYKYRLTKTGRHVDLSELFKGGHE